MKHFAKRVTDTIGELVKAKEPAVAGELENLDFSTTGTPKASGDYRRYVLLGTIILVLGLGGSILWAALAPLAGAVVSNGEIVLQGYRTTIQHLDGGVIAELPIEEGQRVSKGDLLFKLEDSQATSDLAVIEARLLSALGRQARLRAERDDQNKIEFPSRLKNASDSEEASEIMDNQRAIFIARKRALSTDLDRRAQKVQELEQQIRGLESRLVSVDAQIRSFEGEVEERRGLVAEQLTSKVALRDAERRLNDLRGERGRLRSDIAQTKAQIATTQMERSLRQQEYDQEVANNLGTVQGEVLDAQARAVALSERLSRTVVRSPMDGYVTGLQIHAEGTVISPGNAIMDLVPEQRQLLVDVQVPPERIDDVSAGQLTDLSFPSLDSLFVDDIQGEVISISADALTNEQSGERYFLARIQVTNDSEEILSAENFRMTPGMPAQAFIRTGSRSMLGYLAEPFTEMFSRAFREG
jgi:epimerase transport system membrane fusion protein